jgi:outer membrane receptor for ferrienterochelin and colicins
MLRLLFSFFVFTSLCGYSQTFKGLVVDVDGKAVPLASVVWEGYEISSLANDSGYFEIALPPDTTLEIYGLNITFAGNAGYYEIDDLYSQWTFTMDIRVVLQQVTIYDDASGSYISRIIPIKTEVINRNELRKAACCDLAGCFETQSTVQPQTTNILTNAKELRILGLSGVYNQVLVDGLPLVHGLSYTYGISTLPGSMVENIWVVKGANSVVQGYESMVGQITVFPREGQKAEPFTADLLVNSFNEKHMNAGVAWKDSLWNNYLAVHASLPGGRFDRDDDTFLDLPLLTRYTFYNKWRYRNENEDGWSTFIGARFTEEERIGGQYNFDAETQAGKTDAYGQIVRFTQPELFTKTGYRFNANNKISLLASSQQHFQKSWFGVLNYNAEQWYGYANLQYELFFGGSKQHDLKTGLSFRHLEINEDISFTSDTIPRTFDGGYSRLENIPGVFAESIFSIKKDTLTLITGMRADHHNSFGSRFTPRIMVRWLPVANTDIRLSAGTGWRTVSLFSENINLLTSGRDIQFAESLRPEESLNLGFNVTQRFTLGGTSFTATTDIYHTTFQNQVFPNYDSTPNVAIISNFTGTSISNGFQAELIADVSSTVDLRVAYNYLDVYRIVAGEKTLLPFNAKHRVLGVISIHSPQPRWQFDVNIHYYGEQRLPNTDMLVQEYRQPAASKPFTLTSIQYTQSFKRIEFFAGCENVFDFRQKRPIVNWQNPFSQQFDTSFAWGPTRGREMYVGLRMRV